MTKPCCVPGCDQPRYKSYARCEAHQKAQWVSGNNRRRPNVCPLCHRTPEQAALYAAQGIHCTACQTSRIHKVRRKKADTPPDAKIVASRYGEGEGLLLLDATFVDQLPMPPTERERVELVRAFQQRGYWVVEAC